MNRNYFCRMVSYLIIYKKNHKTQRNSREGTANSSRDVYWVKVTQNWRSPADTPSLSPTVVAGLRVCYLRHRSSPETFFFFGNFVHEPICSWWEAFVNWGSTVLIIMTFQYAYNNLFHFSNTSLCSVQESTYYSLCKHEGSLWYSAWAHHMLILLHTVVLKSKLELTTMCLVIVVLDCVNYYHYIIIPFWSYVGPRPTIWFSCSTPMSEDVRHFFFVAFVRLLYCQSLSDAFPHVVWTSANK
jgi:hypothetical protein